jgi:hypothetical protein
LYYSIYISCEDETGYMSATSFIRTIKLAAYNLCGKFTPDGATARRFASKGREPLRMHAYKRNPRG